MSTLLLDIGNSRLKWVLHPHADAPLQPAQAIAHEGAPAAAVATLAAQWAGPSPQRVCIAHVTGSGHEAEIIQAVQHAWRCEPEIARSGSAGDGLKSAYAAPGRLGVDRWLAMLALWSRQRAGFVVASAGTALTFDAVDASGQHQGGVIAPGLSAMIEATLGRTRFAVGSMAAAFETGLGRDTETCVRQGALHATSGLLDRLGRQHPGRKYLAGGDAAVLEPHLDERWQLEPDLVLHGLATWVRLASVR